MVDYMAHFATLRPRQPQRKGQSMRVLAGLLLFIPLCVWGGLRAYHSIDYGRQIEGHLKRAADANTIDLAKRELNTALTEIERRGWSEGGYTNILWTTPENDVGFWYENLKASVTELDRVNEDTSELERSNMLIKLRETLLDHGHEGGETVTQPGGISIFPHNVRYCWLGWGGVLSAIIGTIIVMVGVGVDPRRHNVTLIEILVVISIIGILVALIAGVSFK